MSWSYNTSLLSSSTRTKVRLIIGDTDITRQLLQDEEIDYVITAESVATTAAAVCCDLLAAKYAFLCNTDNGELRISAAARHKHYQDLADRLRKGPAGDVPGDGAAQLATMYVGGQSISASAALDADSDNNPPNFSLGQDDHPNTSFSSTTGGF